MSAPDGARRRTASQWFALAVGALVIVGVLGTVVSVIALNRLGRERVQLTDRLSPAAITAADLRVALTDQETGVRGYALSGDETFLDPYENGRNRAEAALAQLERYARLEGVSPLEREIRTVAAAARRWQGEYAEPTIAQVRAQPGQARSPASIAAGKQRFDAFRAGVEQLQSRLVQTREDARDRLDRNADTVMFWVIGTGIVVLLSVAAVALVLRRQLVRPLQRLAGEVRAVSRGEFERDVTAWGAREVVDLAEDVDVMRARIVAELEGIKAAQSDLKRSNAELEQFAYVASHDLQEPLRKVASFCQLLQQRYGGQLDARADQYIGFAVDGARRMQDLINDLLEFSRIGRVEQPHTAVDCNQLMARVRADLGRVIADSGAEIIAGPLPTVMGDPSLLRVVFQNLCANAIKFRGEATPIVHLDAERDGDCWRFRCADNGIGIAPEYGERIFVLFQRLHSRTQFEGTGIGLAMCRKIVEYHGGRMWLDTGAGADGEGSTFYFTLPAEPEKR